MTNQRAALHWAALFSLEARKRSFSRRDPSARLAEAGLDILFCLTQGRFQKAEKDRPEPRKV
jgi:hypothetical protein